jgi:hypothetical protein
MNYLLTIIVFSAITAVIIVVVLRLFGMENPSAIAGGVAGGVAAAIVSLSKMKKR